MGKLHEILAVEGDLKEKSEKLIREATDTFTKRDAHFLSYFKSYKADREDELPTPEENKAMVETVRGKLKYVANSLEKYIDTVFSKESGNIVAKADIILPSGEALLVAVPAAVLLTLENKFKGWRQMYEAIPTLSPGEDWKLDSKTGTYSVEEYKVRTAKVFKNHVKVAATEKHPAQVELYQQDERVGLTHTVKHSSMLSPKEKSDILTNVDTLILATKQARMRANMADAPNGKIGEKLLSFINGN